jgi:hypothetical protein
MSEKQGDFIRLPGEFDASVEASPFLIPRSHAALVTTLLAFRQVRSVIGDYPRDLFFQVEEKLPLPGLLGQIHDAPLAFPALDPNTGE